jgi:hypothetical protein
MGTFLSDDSLFERETVRERVGSSTFITKTIHTPKGDFVERSREDDGVHTGWTLDYFLKGEADVERVLSLPHSPPRLDLSGYWNVERQLGERGVPIIEIADPICCLMYMAGFMQGALWCRTNPELLIRFVEVMAERLSAVVAEIARQVRRTAFRIVGPEFSAPPLLSAEWFNRLVVPHDARLVRIIRESDASNVAMIHCHGRLDAVWEGIAAIGPHVLEPLEPPPQGDVEMKELRRRAGKDLVLMGYMQFADLEFDTEEETERKVRRAIEDGYRNGGLILIPTAFPIVTPVAPRCERNLMRFITTAKEMTV